jgi:hypothetical protein
MPLSVEREVALALAAVEHPAHVRPGGGHRRPEPPKMPAIAWIDQPSRAALI